MNDVLTLLPEILLVLTLSGIIIAEIGYHGEKVRLVSGIAFFGLLAVVVQIFLAQGLVPGWENRKILDGVLVFDGISLFFKLFFSVLAMIGILVASFSKEIASKRRPEYYAFLIAATFAMFILASTADLLVGFLAFQFLNVMGFLLAGYEKSRLVSTEAAGKQLFFGILSGLFLLLAAGILFHFTRTLNLYEIREVLAQNPLSFDSRLVVFVLIFLSLSFHLGVFPMHYWMSDVLEGAPTPTSAFLSLGFPAAGFVFAIRSFITLFGVPDGADWTLILGLASAVTMTIGALLALRQNSAKRMMACLLVSQGGFLLMSLLVLDAASLSALLFNLIVNLFSLAGIYCAFTILLERTGSDQLSSFRGSVGNATIESIALLIFLGCFVGFPPLPGFIGRFTLIQATFEQGWTILSGLAILSTLFGAIAFARMSYNVVADFAVNSSGAGASTSVSPPPLFQRGFLLALLVPLILLLFLAQPVLEWTRYSARTVLW